ncbi:MAG: calcium/proton exchanger [Planctomycetota bacterium]|jgi:Ca2+:H+ antiporter
MKIGRFDVPVLMLLLVFVPIAVVLELAHGPAAWIFGCSCVAIIPLAGLMGRSTEHLATHFGPGVGGLMNASFGNAAELIIAIMALRAGQLEIVKASLTGSIIGNVLLVLGLSLLLGGLRHQRQHFNRTAAGLGATLLALSAIGLLVPAIFHHVTGSAGDDRIEHLSLAIAIVLFVSYGLSLVFQLKTHGHLFGGESAEMHHEEGPVWSKTRAVIVLTVATAFVALMSEFLVGSVEATAERWGMTEVFIGVIVVAIIGNAAEHSTAILVALKDKMDLSINIAIGSGIQIALFAAPLLVFLSYAFGSPMDLEFTLFEVIAVAMSVFVVNLVAQDGESHWMEGVLLLAVYLVLGIAFYFLPAGSP